MGIIKVGNTLIDASAAEEITFRTRTEEDGFRLFADIRHTDGSQAVVYVGKYTDIKKAEMRTEGKETASPLMEGYFKAVPMSRVFALKVVKSLGTSTYLESEKDTAVRTVLRSKTIPSQLSRADSVRMLEWIYDHYLKEDEK